MSRIISQLTKLFHWLVSGAVFWWWITLIQFSVRIPRVSLMFRLYCFLDHASSVHGRISVVSDEARKYEDHWSERVDRYLQKHNVEKENGLDKTVDLIKTIHRQTGCCRALGVYYDVVEVHGEEEYEVVELEEADLQHVLHHNRLLACSCNRIHVRIYLFCNLVQIWESVEMETYIRKNKRK